MATVLRNSDAFMLALGRDPRLRSTIVTVTVLAQTPDWQEVVRRFRFLTDNAVGFRARIIPGSRVRRPRWQAASTVDLRDHVQRVAAPQPADVSVLLELAGTAAMADFDASRPLWEATLVDGLIDGRAALICRFSHALTDGIGAVQLAAALFDDTDRYDESVPDGFEQIARGQSNGDADTVASVVRKVWRGIRHPTRALSAAGATAASVARITRPTYRRQSPLMAERSPNRRLAVHQVATESLRSAGGAAGGTLNDAFIAAVVGGLHRYHARHGTQVNDMLVMMPISIRRSNDNVGGNRATLVRFTVPAVQCTAAQRIASVHMQTSRVRAEKALGNTEFVAGLLGAAPRWYVATNLSQVDFIASDVPGFPAPVYLAGAPVESQIAFSPTLGAALNVTLLSYAGTSTLGINVDTAAIRDCDDLRECLVEGIDDVIALADTQPITARSSSVGRSAAE